jgi:5-methylcytosine-specific restriction protein A
LNVRDHSFVVGQVYNRRRDIHGRFSGQSRGGISTPTTAKLIFIFTSDAGKAFGYEDTFKPDGTFWYTGEGQVGDMRMIRGNAALANHRADGKSVLLYESTSDEQVRFLGEVECLGHHFEDRPDRDGSQRRAIIFHLGFLPQIGLSKVDQAGRTYVTGTKLPPRLSLEELRQIALEGLSPDATIEEKRANVARRAEAIRRYALKRAAGSCEACHLKAPFKSRSGPFLEVHHVHRLADGGPDHPANVIALCPNCHRRAHFSTDAKVFNEELVEWLSKAESGQD